MKLSLSVLAVSFAFVMIVVAAPIFVDAADTIGSARSMTQSDVAVQVYQAAYPYGPSVSDDEALQTLQARGVVPKSWVGRSAVTLAEVEQIMLQMGVDVQQTSSDTVVSGGELDQLLKAHRAQLSEVGESWETQDEFSQYVILGGGDRRVISGQDW